MYLDCDTGFSEVHQRYNAPGRDFGRYCVLHICAFSRAARSMRDVISPLNSETIIPIFIIYTFACSNNSVPSTNGIPFCLAYFAALSKESAEYVCASIISQINAAGDNPAIFNKYTDISVCPRLSASMPFDASSSGRCPGVTNEDTNFSFKFGLPYSFAISRAVRALSVSVIPVYVLRWFTCIEKEGRSP